MYYLPLPPAGHLPAPMEKWLDVLDFDPGIMINYPVLHRRKSKNPKPDLLDCVCAFDIETTNIDSIEQAVMYIWQFQIDEDLTVFGRTWEEFLNMLQAIAEVLPANCNLVIYVHNLQFEFSFLKGVYDFKKEEVFAIQRRKVLRCDMFGRFEFRCSYLLSNMSLKDFTRKWKVKHQKLNDYDYGIPLYPWSDMTIEQLRYCQNDVLGLVEAVRAAMIADKDTLISIPLTSTGYVRRECKKVVFDNLGYRYAEPYFPGPVLYKLMRQAFRGGDTTSNRFYTDDILENVHSWDRSSSYPDVLCNCRYPIKPFTQVEFPKTRQYLDKLIFVRHRAILMEVKLTNVKLKNYFWGDPYLTKDKSRKIVNPQIYNGRILAAEYLETSLTDIDYRIIREIYDFDMEVMQYWVSRYGPLPECLKEFIIELYKKKTELKGLPGEFNETLYQKSKNMLNGIYGMFATDPIRAAIEYMAEDRDFHYNETMTEEELFEKCKKSYWLPYQFGVWTTALARYRLFEGIRLVTVNQSKPGPEFADFVYCDTDSVKYIGHADWTAYNAERIKDSTNSGAYAIDSKGKTHYMGVYEQEDDYDRFKTCGSKKYAYEIDGKLHVTIAGVAKKAGAAELAKHGGLEALQDGFVFREAGGLCARYNDLPEVSSYRVEPTWKDPGGLLKITANEFLSESEYTLGTMEEYKRIITMSKIEFERVIKILWKEEFD